MKVLIVASECSPLVKVGGVADVVGSLPIALKSLDMDVRVVIPFYKTLIDKINNSDQSILEVKKSADFEIKWGPKTLKCDIFETKIPYTNIPVYLVHNEELISNGGVYFSPETMASPEMELERFALFSKVVANFFGLQNKVFLPDVIHCNDWHTGMIPQILRNMGRFTKLPKVIKTVFSIHNLAYQGFSNTDVASKLGLNINADKLLKWDAEDNNLDFVLQGIIGADYISTVSEKYAEEIKTPEFGEGLDEIIKSRSGRLIGILNGISYEIFNPATDDLISFKFSVGNAKEGKAINKADLQKAFKLDVNPNKPLIGVISRLAHQKGLDIVYESVRDIVEMGYQLVILGTGDPMLQSGFAELNNDPELRKNYVAYITFSEELARKIYASSDMFLIPSRYEPCGLTQMIAMKYGAVPVVRATGGLYDTVQDNETGFVYNDFSKQDMLTALQRALIKYTQEKATWDKIVKNAISKDFSWQQSARKYLRLYNMAMSA